MADFCKQCSIDQFGEDFGDVAGLCEEGEMVRILCEGCAEGFVWVDHTGLRVDPEKWTHWHGDSEVIDA